MEKKDMQNTVLFLFYFLRFVKGMHVTVLAQRDQA